MDHYNIFRIFLLSFLYNQAFSSRTSCQKKFIQGIFNLFFPTFRSNFLLSGTTVQLLITLSYRSHYQTLGSSVLYLRFFISSFQISHASVRVPFVVVYFIEIRISFYSWLVVLYGKCFQLYIHFLIYKCLVLNPLKRSF